MIKLDTYVIKQVSILPGVTIPIVVHILVNDILLDIRESLIIMKNANKNLIQKKKLSKRSINWRLTLKRRRRVS